jgi:hypothetical protein
LLGVNPARLDFWRRQAEEKVMNRKRGLAIWQWGLALVLVLALVWPAAAASTWLQLNPAPDPNYGFPIPCWGYSLVYNSTSNRLIVFGGAFAHQYSVVNDVWVLTNADGQGGSPTWIKLNPLTPNGAPAPRYLHAAAYDQAHNRMIVHGGDTRPGYNGGFVSDTWILTNADGTGGDPTWIPLSTLGPAPFRRAHIAGYDAINNRMIVYGGGSQVTTVDDTFVLTNANGLGGESSTWTALDAAFAIPSDEYPITGPGGYDPASNTLVDFLHTQAPNLNMIRVLSNANGMGGPAAWTELASTGTPPSLRESEYGAYDATRNSMVIFGGYSQVEPIIALNDVWRLNHANGRGGTPQWTQLNPGGTLPEPRFYGYPNGGTGAYNPASDRMIVFGGFILPSWDCLVDVWVLTEAMGPPPVINVSIDIKPGSDVNSINPDSQGKIAVAILSKPDFNAPEMVDWGSLKFGETGTEVLSLAFCTVEDVNADGRPDLVAHFYTQQTGFETGDTQGYLKGQTIDGTPLSGSDAVRIVPGK